MSNIGFKIFEDFYRVEKEIIEQLKKIPTTNIADALSSRNLVSDRELYAYHKSGLRMTGTAMTVKVPSGDNLMVQKAIQIAKAGDVIVIEQLEQSNDALVGDLVCQFAKNKGVAGFIVDGAIRDRVGIFEMELPVYARGVVPRGANKEGPGEINVPICCKGMEVNPGDIVVGDDDGIVIIPSEQAVAILHKAKQKDKEDKEKMIKIRNRTFNYNYVDEILKKKGCEHHSSFKGSRN